MSHFLGAPLVWWEAFLAKIEKEQKDQCPDCLLHLRRLAGLRLTKRDPQVKQKREARNDVDKDLEAHLDSECKYIVREKFWPLRKRRDVVHGPSASSPPVAPLENELLLPDTGLPLIYKRSSLPNKLKERPKSVKAGEYIAVKGTKQHPFYIWKIVKVRKPYLDFQWLEREPNGVYTLLDQVDSEHIFYLVD